MSQSVAHELAKANESYVQNFGDRGNLPLPPGRKVAVITYALTLSGGDVVPLAHCGPLGAWTRESIHMRVLASKKARPMSSATPVVGRTLSLPTTTARKTDSLSRPCRSHDALRSVIISQQLLGTKEIVVFHHTDCGMLTFNDEALRSKLKDGVPAEHRAAIAPVIENFSFLPFSDISETVRGFES